MDRFFGESTGRRFVLVRFFKSFTLLSILIVQLQLTVTADGSLAQLLHGYHRHHHPEVLQGHNFHPSQVRWTKPPERRTHQGRPVDVMTDVINDLGFMILDRYVENVGNVGFSPSGLGFVLVALYEGSAGSSSRQIGDVLRLPHDRRVTRIGLRDIHRRLRSYLNADAFLGGLTLNRDDINLRPEYEDILRFYGFNISDSGINADATTTTSRDTTNSTTDSPSTTDPMTPGSMLADSTDMMTMQMSTASPSPMTTQMSTDPSSSMPTTINDAVEIITDMITGGTNSALSVASTGGNPSTNAIPMSLSAISQTVAMTIPTIPTSSETSGTSGTSGISGTSGTNGTSSTSGTSGTRGTSGTSGTGGTSGTSGTGGTNGTSDPSTMSGTSGPSRMSGTNGTGGTSGTGRTSETIGTNGTSETSETSGTSGTSGSSGTSETRGTTETSRSTGASGATETNGDTGTSGTTGLSGITGTNGSTGTSDATGTSETSGTTGTGGPRGISGTSETTGISGTNDAPTTTPMTTTQAISTVPSTASTLTISSTVQGNPNSSDAPSTTMRVQRLFGPPPPRMNPPLTLAQSSTSLTTTMEDRTTNPTSTPASSSVSMSMGISAQTTANSSTTTQTETSTKNPAENPTSPMSTSVSMSMSMSIGNSSATDVNSSATLQTENSTTSSVDDTATNSIRKRRGVAHGPTGFFSSSADDGIWLEEFGRSSGHEDYPSQDDDIVVDPRRPTEVAFLVNGCDYSRVTAAAYTAVLPFAYFPSLRASMLEFPLDDPRYKILVMLPSESNGTRRLARLLASKPITLRRLRHSLQADWITAVIPSFMLRGFVTLTSFLQRLGITDVFEPRAADLSPMSPDLGVYARDIQQSIGVNIRNNVKGGVGGAGDGNLDRQRQSRSTDRARGPRGVLPPFFAADRPISPPTRGSDPRYSPYPGAGNVLYEKPHPVPFVVDRSFLYFIVDDETSVTLLAGRIDDPLNSRML